MDEYEAFVGDDWWKKEVVTKKPAETTLSPVRMSRGLLWN
jgi:hypothetical protein